MMSKIHAHSPCIRPIAQYGTAGIRKICATHGLQMVSTTWRRKGPGVPGKGGDSLSPRFWPLSSPWGVSVRPPPALPGLSLPFHQRILVLHAEVGVASWYGHPYHGRRAAGGQIYDMNQLTAAHRTLPFGTRVRVHNLENDASVEVVINDRGPYHRREDSSTCRLLPRAFSSWSKAGPGPSAA